MIISGTTTAQSAFSSLAHLSPIHGITDFASGLVHPFLGLDHLLAMLAVGMWAVQLGGRARWILPTAFVLATMLGVFGAMPVREMLFLEYGVIGSVVIFGLMLALANLTGIAIATSLTASLALFHGHVHGMEQSLAGSTGIAYPAGIVITTLAIQFAGIGIAAALGRMSHLPLLRIAGGAVCLAGIVLFAV